MLVAALFAVVGLPIGVFVQRRLAAGAWRRADDATSPVPSFVWVPPVMAAVVGLVAWRTSALSWWTTPAYLLLAVIGVCLAAIDSDVHRLPDRLTLHPLPALAVGLVVASAGLQQWGRLPLAAACGLLAGLAFLALALAVPSGLGLGDVKLALLLAVALGWLGVLTVIGWIFYGFLFGGLWALVLLLTRRATRKTHVAFGPPLLLGALVALLGTGSL